MTPRKLDHVALYVTDADAVAACILALLPFRIIEETDEFLLIGRDPLLGKLTLLRAEGSREPGALIRVGIGIPCGTVERTLELGDGLELALVPSDPDGEVELDHVALATPDPASSARAWLELGFDPAPKSANGVPRVRVGEQYVELHQGSPARSQERPLLGHLGLLVDSVDDVRLAAERQALDVREVVDDENSKALFLRGPDGIELEYIEHKPSFAFA